MKKILSFILLGLMCSIGNLWADSKTYTFDDDVALETDWTVTTDVPTGGTANCLITNSLTGSSFNAHPNGNSNYLGLAYLNKGNVGITIVSEASYSNITAISIDAVANDNSKPTIAAYIVTAEGDYEVFAAIGTKDGFATGGSNKWGTKTVSNIPSKTGKLKIVTTASSSGKYAALDNIVITYGAGGPTPEPGDPVDPTITFNAGAYTVGGAALDLSTLFTSNSTGAVTYSVKTEGGTGAAIAGTSFTATAAGTAVVTASQAAAAGYNAKSVDANIVVSAAAPQPAAGDVVFSADVVATAKKSFAQSSSTAITASDATLVGGTMTAINNETSDKDLINKQSNYYMFCMTNNGTFFKVELNQALAEGDVISAKTYTRTDTELGLWISTATSRPGSCSSALTIAAATTAGYESLSDYTVTSTDGLVGATTIYIYRHTGKSTYFNEFKIVRPAATEPTITTQPVGASYVTGDPISPLTIAATASSGTLTYQWYSCDDAEKTNAAAIGGATSASYTPVAAGFYYVKVTDDNGNIDSDVVEIVISAAVAPTITTDLAATAQVAKGVPQVFTIVATGVPTPEYQWYLDGAAIDGATEASYTYTATNPGTHNLFCIASNGVGEDAWSTACAVTCPASKACVLNQVVYSNTFDAFINAPVAEVLYTDAEEAAAAGKEIGDVKTPAANGTIKAYYLEGESAPTINSVIVSDYATYAVVGNTLTVTAEDGVTNAVYDITVEEVEPYAGEGKRVFDGTETWVKTGNTFSTDEGKMGWKFSKTDNDWSRERDGRTRIYFFLGPNAQVSFENGGSSRNIKVYRNGNLLNSPTSTGDCIVMGDSENAYMLAIVSNQTSGDGALKSITVDPSKLTLGANGYSTYAADFKYTVSGAEVYKAAYNGSDAVVLTEVVDAVVPANQGIILKGEEGATVTITPSDETASDFSGNGLVGVVAPTAAEADWYVLTTNAGVTAFNPCQVGLEIPAHKAYISIPSNAPAVRIIFAENGATGINELEGAEKAVKFIENGKLYIQKDGVVYDATGAKVK